MANLFSFFLNQSCHLYHVQDNFPPYTVAAIVKLTIVSTSLINSKLQC